MPGATIIMGMGPASQAVTPRRPAPLSLGRSIYRQDKFTHSFMARVGIAGTAALTQGDLRYLLVDDAAGTTTPQDHQQAPGGGQPQHRARLLDIRGGLRLKAPPGGA
jgi:hypothetical protein